MKYSESVSCAWSPRVLLVVGLLGGAVAPGCGLRVSVNSNEERSESTGSGEDSTTGSGSGTTGAGGVSSEDMAGTSSGSSSGAVSTSGDSTCGGFSCAVDMPLEGCDVFAQDCPEGEKCAPVITDGGGAWNWARCVPVLGGGAPGEACTAESVAEGLDSCAEGAICWGVDMEGKGSCVGQCAGSPEAPVCANEGICTVSGSGVLNLCLPYCDPLLQDCAEGAACYPLGDRFSCIPDASGDAGELNDACELINVCAAGLFCAKPAAVGAGCAPGSLGCCTPFCALPKGSCPNPDQQCLPWLGPDMLPVGAPWAGLGFCGVLQ